MNFAAHFRHAVCKRTLGRVFLCLLAACAAFGFGSRQLFAQVSPSTLYVPLIGISSVPDPLALPKGPGNVTYHYAVKNFLQETALTNVGVTDDKCSPVKFVEGDDNGDGKLDFSETWRYACTTKLSETTQSVATAIGTANGLPAAHKAYATVVVGSDAAAPLVNIINITKVAYPLALPSQGGDITFVYRVNNPGVVPLSDVSVTDDKCSGMSNKLGDTNNNGLLDITEVWIYTCKTHLTETTTNTASVKASANGLQAVGYATITVTVAPPGFQGQNPPSLPSAGGATFDPNVAIWGVMVGILAGLFALAAAIKPKKRKGDKKRPHPWVRPLFLGLSFAVAAGLALYVLSSLRTNPGKPLGAAPSTPLADASFGWKYPVTGLPSTGADKLLAYSSIRDPGGIPQGLPVRLQIPAIGVDSGIEDALITPDGRMDVPVGSVHVAWFALGPHPGQAGSAVIGGHFGINNGVPFVFYNLDKLKVGDKAYVVDDKGETLAFVVRDIKLFERNADATSVFTSNDGLAHLNLVTCEGIWNQVNGTYPLRRVVLTDAIAGEGTVVITKVPPASFTRTLASGAKGADVVNLQTALVDRGFLTIPAGVTKGFYGKLTRLAVAKYQTSVGLASNGVFGTATRAKLLADLASVLPNTGTVAAIPTPATVEPVPAPTAPTAWQLLQNLYATPAEAAVTSVLLLAILLSTFIVVKRRF